MGLNLQLKVAEVTSVTSGHDGGLAVLDPTAQAVPARLLVVEDSPSDRRLIKEMLVDAGAAPGGVTCVGSLAEARRTLTELQPDCILIDLALPDAMGLEGVAVMSSAAPDVPMIVVSGQPADSLVYAAMAEGADEYLCKADLDPSHLKDVLIRAAQRRRGNQGSQRQSATAALVLDSIEAPTVALDGSGRIIAVNNAWSMAAVTRGVDLTAAGVGVNYLTVCEQAEGPYSEGALDVAAGIRKVLHGETDRFAADYPCFEEDGERWFSVRVTPTGELGGGAVITHLDITDLKRAELQLRQQEARLHSVFDETAPIFFLLGADGVIQHVSEATGQLMGVHQHDAVGAKAFDRIEPRDRERAVAALERILEVPGGTERLQIRAVDTNGRWHELDIAIANLLDDPKVGAIAVTGSDVTEGHFNQITRRLENQLLQLLPTAITVTDDRGVVIYWNDRAATLFGYTQTQAVGRPIADLKIAPKDAVEAMSMNSQVRSSGRWEGDYETVRADGSSVPIHMTLERVEVEDIGFHGMVGASVDISERRLLEENLAFQALHDSLTGLPNRRLFIDHLDKSLSRASRSGKRTAVLFIDLDDFKAVNDRIGHVAGDNVLRRVGELIGGVLRAGDLAARLGGDEFVVCCDDLDDLEGPEGAFVVADRISKVLAEPFLVGDEVTVASASIGVALSGLHSSAEGLMRNADIAMYAAKQAGKARVELFDDALHAQVRRRHDLALQLEEALDMGQIQTLFQPEVDLTTGELVGFEALARWPHPERGMVPPDEFIPIAEESGLIGRLGRDVLQDACQALRIWLDTVPDRPMKVAVNVSTRQLSDPSFPEMVRRVIAEAAVPPESICLEVTESALIDADVAAAALWELKSAGVEIAIDDFGTGYSSLSRLHKFPLDYLKIDRSFVDGMMNRSEDAIIVSSVLGLAHGLGIHTIAEGIEDQAQWDELAAAGCHFGQGWLWSPAVSLEQASELVARTGSLPKADKA